MPSSPQNQGTVFGHGPLTIRPLPCPIHRSGRRPARARAGVINGRCGYRVDIVCFQLRMGRVGGFEDHELQSGRAGRWAGTEHLA